MCCARMSAHVSAAEGARRTDVEQRDYTLAVCDNLIPACFGSVPVCTGQSRSFTHMSDQTHMIMDIQTLSMQ